MTFEMTPSFVSEAAPVEDISVMVARRGALPDAPLAMPVQVLEAPGAWRLALARLIAGPGAARRLRHGA